MVGNMIKICSLDFLNSKSFEADVKTVDGKILFNSGDKITPEIILKLYFKNIYIEKSLEETEPISKHKTEIEIEDVEITRVGNTNISSAGQVATNNVIDGVLGEVKDENAEEEVLVATAEEEEEEEKEEALNRTINETNSSANNKKNVTKHSSSTKIKEPEVPKQNPDDIPLEFDEQEAKRIIKSSIAIGKMLNFSQKELKELEQVAYYYNIGITKFKKGDLKQKDFRKMKVFASYTQLVKEEIVPNEISEMVKYCANNYESEAFPLNSKIPYHHIVSITSYYEELLAQNNSKEETLLKMLQLGGNQFNTFILHKFIKMMREINE